MWRAQSSALAAGVALTVCLGGAESASAVTIDTEASYDRWMYPFNGTPGTRGTSPIFGAVDNEDEAFDERDGQFHVGFDTAAAGATPGLGASNYEIVSAVVTATHSQGTFVYDPTYDSYLTYDGTQMDSDPGRPIELHGLGFRNGFTSIELSPGIPGPPGFEETDAFAFGDPTLAEVRNVFAANASVLDISNNVGAGFESDPWAIGQGIGLSPGDSVAEGVAGMSAGTTFAFDIDLSDPNIVAYLQAGLNAGVLGFAITSLHEVEMSGGTNPNFYTSDNFDPAAIAPGLMLEFNVVPEPSTGLLLLGGCAGLGLTGRRRIPPTAP